MSARKGGEGDYRLSGDAENEPRVLGLGVLSWAGGVRTLQDEFELLESTFQRATCPPKCGSRRRG